MYRAVAGRRISGLIYGDAAPAVVWEETAEVKDNTVEKLFYSSRMCGG